MKRVIFTLLFIGAAITCSATTYYWIGGLTATSWTSGNNWTTDPIGRAPVGGTITVGTTDVFIFDGTNVGGAVVVTGPVVLSSTSLSATPFAQLKIINSANITINRATTASAVFPLNGDGTAADDLVVDATSTLTLGGPSGNFDVQITMTAATTGLISGNLYLSPISNTVHTRSYITAAGTSSLVFATGSNCYVTDSTASSGFNASLAKTIVFQSGASLYYYTGRSPIGSNSSTQFIDFQPGSNCYFMKSNVSYIDGVTPYTSSSWTNNKSFGNLFIQNNASLTADGPIWKIENFTINTGSTFTTHTSGQTGIIGTLTVNGNITAPLGSTNNLVFGADGVQSITGTGTIDIGVMTVSAITSLQLGDNIILESLNTSAVFGLLDFGTKQISGPGTFSAKGIATPIAWTGNLTAGSYQITGAGLALSGLAGMIATGPGIPANTTVIAFSGGGQTINLSKPATATTIGGTFTFTTNSPSTLVTSNPAGLDGSVSTTTRSFSSSANYTFNAATSAPFPTSATPDSAGNISINAPVTTNNTITIGGTLSLNNNLTIRPLDTFHITSTNPIAGAPFSLSKHIITQVNNGTGDKGVLKVDGFTTPYLFPVGSSTSYLPATLSPVTSSDFAVTAFEGITQSGQPNGVPFTPSQKANVVDAVWILNRLSANVDSCTMTLNWPASLEGSTFTTYSNSQVGVAKNSGGTWGIAIGTGDNTNNTATNTFNSFSPFAVGNIGTPLPVKITNLNANVDQGRVKLQFTNEAEFNISSYSIERSSTGTSFSAIGSVIANGSHQYTWYDNTPFTTNNYYRIAIKDINGNITYSSIVRVMLKANSEISVYPNPVSGNLLNLQLSNLTLGKVEINLYNNAGQQVLSTSVEYNGGIQTQSIQLPLLIAKGNYLLTLKTVDAKSLKQMVLIQ